MLLAIGMILNIAAAGLKLSFNASSLANNQVKANLVFDYKLEKDTTKGRNFFRRPAIFPETVVRDDLLRDCFDPRGYSDEKYCAGLFVPLIWGYMLSGNIKTRMQLMDVEQSFTASSFRTKMFDVQSNILINTSSVAASKISTKNFNQESMSGVFSIPDTGIVSDIKLAGSRSYYYKKNSSDVDSKILLAFKSAVSGNQSLLSLVDDTKTQVIVTLSDVTIQEWVWYGGFKTVLNGIFRCSRSAIKDNVEIDYDCNPAKLGNAQYSKPILRTLSIYPGKVINDQWVEYNLFD